MRTILIHVNLGGSFDVVEGERIADGLTWDEMLGEVARLTGSGQPRDGRYIKHIDDALAERERWRAQAAERNRKSEETP